jgi:hypothetical protein
VPPSEFADLVVALCFWLAGGGNLPFINWENNGSTGATFTSRIIELKYPNVYYTASGTDQFWSKKSKKLGFFNNRVDRVMSPLRNSLHTGKVTLRSDECLRELGEYIYDNDRWVHPGSKTSRDASTAGQNHGDRAIAAAIAVIALKDRGYIQHTSVTATTPEAAKVSPKSTAGRFEAWKKNQKKKRLLTTCVW